MHPLALLVVKLAAQTSLAPADRQAILDLPVTTRMLEPNAYLLREGEAPTRCGVMISGFAFRHKLTNEGARQVVSLHVAGDPMDFQSLFLDVADHNIQTLTRAEIAFIPREDLQRLVRASQGVAHAVQVNTLIEASWFREWIVNIGRRDAKARIAHLLCELTLRLQAIGLVKDGRFELPMTQEQLGDATGLTPVHVNRTLRALELEGLISRAKRSIHTLDWEKLRALSGFNARYLYLDRQETG